MFFLFVSFYTILNQRLKIFWSSTPTTFSYKSPLNDNIKQLPSRLSMFLLRNSVSLESIMGKSKCDFWLLAMSICCCICIWCLCFSKFAFSLSIFCCAITRFCCCIIAAVICCWVGATDFGLSNSCLLSIPPCWKFTHINKVLLGNFQYKKKKNRIELK